MNEFSTKTDDGFQAVSDEQLMQIEGGDSMTGAVLPVTVVTVAPMDVYMHSLRGSNDRLVEAETRTAPPIRA